MLANAVPGFFFALVSMVLLLIASSSVPLLKQVHFLDATINDQPTTFGLWGYCVEGLCMPTRYGYVYNATQSLGNCSAGTNSTEGMVSGWEGMVMDVFEGFENDTLGYQTNIIQKNLTRSFAMIPLGAALAFLASIFTLIGITPRQSRTISVLASVFSMLAAIVVGVAFDLCIVTFSIAKTRIKGTCGRARLSNGNWLVLGAFVGLMLSFGFAVAAARAQFIRARALRRAGAGRGRGGAGAGAGRGGGGRGGGRGRR